MLSQMIMNNFFYYEEKNKIGNFFEFKEKMLKINYFK